MQSDYLGVPLRFATGRHITGFASLGASHASPLHVPHANPHVPRLKTTNHGNPTFPVILIQTTA